MTPAYALAHVLPAALALLPAKMDTPQARAMLLAVGLQESKFQHRRQVGGPARGYWQFELAGVDGVFVHSASHEHARRVCAALDYHSDTVDVRLAIADNDILACAFARLLLWTLPDALPGRDEPDVAWAQYLDAWRPGKPHPETWAAHWATAWATVEAA